MWDNNMWLTHYELKPDMLEWERREQEEEREGEEEMDRNSDTAFKYVEEKDIQP